MGFFVAVGAGVVITDAPTVSPKLVPLTEVVLLLDVAVMLNPTKYCIYFAVLLSAIAAINSPTLI